MGLVPLSCIMKEIHCNCTFVKERQDTEKEVWP
jgi:hypothetical protein